MFYHCYSRNCGLRLVYHGVQGIDLKKGKRMEEPPYAEKHKTGVMTKGQNPKAFFTLEQMGTASHGQSSKKENR